MFKRIFIFLAVIFMVTGTAIFVVGDPAAAQRTWIAYQNALQRGDFHRAARYVDDEVFAFEERARKQAINADADELAKRSTLELGFVLGIRKAVFEHRLAIEDVLAPKSREAFSASFQKATASKVLTESALLAVLPLGPSRAIGWFGPRAYADEPGTLLFSIVFEMRVDFARDGERWRLNYMPAMSSSAREHDAIGASAKGASVAEMKRYYNAVLANRNAELQTALWTPLNAVKSN